MGEILVLTGDVTNVFSSLDFSPMVTMAESIIPVAITAAMPIWSIRFGWNFLRGMVTGL